jgi:phosphopantothenate---cysteine ligase (CTP)
MNVLVTAGNTLTLIDKVRGITNVFTGRTGAQIAVAARGRGHSVTLLTSHPTAAEARGGTPTPTDRWAIALYKTFEDLEIRLQDAVRDGGFDVIVHSAAVSDYRADGVYAPAAGTHFEPASGRWCGDPPALADRAAGKVKSDEPELWLRLVRTKKLVDAIRRDWGFRGLLVKFKLEVGIGDAELLATAERSRQHSAADLMVANTLEGAAEYAFLGPLNGQYRRVERAELAERLLDAVEARYAGAHGGG